MLKPQPKSIVDFSPFRSAGELCFGSIDRVENGSVWVRLASDDGPIQARLTGSVVSRLTRTPPGQLGGAEVVVCLGQPGEAPVIIDMIFDQVPCSIASHELASPGCVDEVRVDGKKIAIEADESIEFRCGESKLIFTADGKILLRGKQVTSQASDHNVIRGAVVKIN